MRAAGQTGGVFVVASAFGIWRAAENGGSAEARAAESGDRKAEPGKRRSRKQKGVARVPPHDASLISPLSRRQPRPRVGRRRPRADFVTGDLAGDCSLTHPPATCDWRSPLAIARWRIHLPPGFGLATVPVATLPDTRCHIAAASHAVPSWRRGALRSCRIFIRDRRGSQGRPPSNAQPALVELGWPFAMRRCWTKTRSTNSHELGHLGKLGIAGSKMRFCLARWSNSVGDVRRVG